MRFAKFALAIVLAASAADAHDWLQFQYDTGNQGRAPQPVEPPFQLRWVWYGEDNAVAVGHPCPEGQVPRPPLETTAKLSFTMHAVVAEGRVFFGDLEGKFFCLDARDGTTVWKREFPGAFLHAAAIVLAERLIVTTCQDGSIYGLEWDGTTRWQVRADRPFVTPPKITNSSVFAGSLDGRMYAVDAATGQVQWTYDAEAAIRQPAAIADGRVFFGSENMIFHAVDAASGRAVWRTSPGQMSGQSFRTTWPVVVGDRVMTFQVLVDGQSEFIMEALLFHATPGDHQHKRLEDWPLERNAILGWLRGEMTWAKDCNKSWQENPGKLHDGPPDVRWAGGPLRKSFYVFDVAGDGSGNARERFQVPMGIVGGTGNANMGPVLDAQGRPVTWWRVSARSIITGQSFGTAFSPDLSALDLESGDRIILPTRRDIHRGGPGMELDNHHMLTAAGAYLYYHNPFRQARWVRLDGDQNPTGAISAVYRRHDGGGWTADVVYYPDKPSAGERAERIYDSHGAARTPVVIADNALFVNEIDIRALACYESQQNAAAVGASQASARATVPAEKHLQPSEAASSDRELEAYVWQRRQIDTIGPQANALRGRLTEHVAEMVDAGHLLPYYVKRGENQPRWYFTNPGDTVAALSRAFPYLSADLQPKVAHYLRQELADYPPCGDRLNRPGDPGVSRMAFVVPEHQGEWRDDRYRPLPRLHNLYSVWLYADATGDLSYVRENWPVMLDFYHRHRNDRTLYVGGASGAIGLARLAALVDDADSRQAAVRDACESLASLDNMMERDIDAAARFGFANDWAESFLYRGFHLLHLTPEVARYLREREPVRRAIIARTTEATDHWPMWFASQATAFTRYYGESHALPPDFSAMIFPVKALLEQAPSQRLQVWTDAEDSPRGDLFYIERLVLAIESFGRESWVASDR